MDLLKRLFRKNRKDTTVRKQKEYILSCDFGYDITSPIPSVEPVHENSHCDVPAVVGTTVKLFPPKGLEVAEFVSYLKDEDGVINGVRCRIRPDPDISVYLCIADDPAWEVDLVCGKPESIDDNRYEFGKNTHTYKRLLLLQKDSSGTG